MCGLTSSQRISLSRQTSLASHILRVSAGDDASGDASGDAGGGDVDGDGDEEVVGGIMYFTFWKFLQLSRQKSCHVVCWDEWITKLLKFSLNKAKLGAQLSPKWSLISRIWKKEAKVMRVD